MKNTSSHYLRIIVGAVCLYSIVVPIHSAENERDVIRRIVSAKVDGTFTEWLGRSFTLLSCPAYAESKFNGISRMGWTKEGLFFALDIQSETLSSGTPKKNPYSIDLFVDLRPSGAPLDRYEDGVFHLVIVPPLKEKLPPTQLDDQLRPVQNTALLDAQLFSEITKSGWRGEYFIPWAALGGYSPRKDAWIGASLRVNCKIEGQAPLTIGATSVDNRNTLETTPVAFAPTRLEEEDPLSEIVSWRCEEILVQGDPWLEIYAAFLTKDSSALGKELTISFSRNGKIVKIPFVLSPSGRYMTASDRFDLSTFSRTGGPIEVTFTLTRDWRRDILVDTPVANRIATINESLPESELIKLPPFEQGVAQVLKACAKECADLLSSSPDKIVPPQHKFRAFLNPKLYDNEIGLFLSLAKDLLNGKRLPNTFPFRGWKSKIDGSWLPIKVEYPWNFDPTITYPATFVIYGLSSTRTRAEFVEPDLVSSESHQFYPFVGENFTITLYGRGNSHANLGREEEQYAIEQIIPTLPIDRNRICLYGGSFGAQVAMQFALQTPDHYSSIYCRGGGFDWLFNRTPLQNTSLVKNLTNVPVYLTAGDNDNTVTKSNRKLINLFTSAEIKSYYHEWANTGHLFSPDDPPKEITEAVRPDVPQNISFVSDTVDFGKAYWLSIDLFDNPSEQAQITAELIPNAKVSVDTVNAKAISIDLSQFKPQLFPLQILLNRTVVDSFAQKPTDSPHTYYRSEGGWKQDSLPLGLIKKRGRCGPAAEIELKPMLLVYGTLNPETSSALRRRAFQIVETRVGTDIGQWGGGHFEIRADKELSTKDISDHNLWLIGGTDDNSVTASFKKTLPNLYSDGSAKLPGLKLFAKNMLTSYIYPHPGNSSAYIYVEEGNTLLSYTADVLKQPYADICVQEVSDAGPVVLGVGMFDREWRLSETR